MDKIQYLQNTCSCVHLNDIIAYDINDGLELKLTLKAFDTKGIIYFTNYDWFNYTEERFNLFKLGFRQIGSYISENNNKVYIMFREPQI